MSCGDEDCEFCPPELPRDLEFEGFRAGVYQAASILQAPAEVLIDLAFAPTRAQVITLFHSWISG